MSYLLSDGFHNALVETGLGNFISRRSNYYYFIGNVLEWDDPQFPESPESTRSYEDFTRKGIFAVKKINLRDVSLVVPRRDWTSGTVYDQWDGDYSTNYPSDSGATDVTGATFYVLTSTFNVYKCIFNNNGAESTEEPSGQDITMITTSDGYVWKYMYTIPLSSQNRFLTADFMPVQRAVTQAYYSRGEVSSVTIDNPGSGYSGNAEVSLSVVGTFLGGSGNSIANLRPVLNSAGEFIDVVILDAGAKYKEASIIITDNLGSGSSHNNNVSNVRIYNPGAGYNAAAIANTTISIVTTGAVQPSANAFANLIFSSNALVAIDLVNPGSQYSTAAKANTTVTIATTGAIQPTSNATANIYYNTTAVLKPRLANGSIQSVIIEDQGKGYSANAQTTISTIGDGTGVVLTPVISPAGLLEDVIIEDRGYGYTNLNITVVGAGSNANVVANLSTEDLDTLQTVVELSAIKGGLHAFRVHNGGNGYSHANVTVTGDGEGFVGNVVLLNNAVSYITVTSPGTNYTFANVAITGDGGNANVSAILSPYGGHGFNPVKELYADSIMFTSTINNEKNQGIVVSNDYRQFGIIKDVTQHESYRAFTGTSGSGCHLITMDSVSGIDKDDYLIHRHGSNVEHRMLVVEVLPATNQLLVINLDGVDVMQGIEVYESVSNTAYILQTIDAEPDIDRFSGDILYIDNRTSVSYSAQQLVTLRTVITV